MLSRLAPFLRVHLSEPLHVHAAHNSELGKRKNTIVTVNIEYAPSALSPAKFYGALYCRKREVR
jgi:hypothetical protein